MLLLLLCVAKGSSSPKLWEADDSNRISTLQGKPNTHVWNNIGSFPNNRLLFFPACGQSHSPRLQGTIYLPAPVVLININIMKNLFLRESER